MTNMNRFRILGVSMITALAMLTAGQALAQQAPSVWQPQPTEQTQQKDSCGNFSCNAY